MKFAKLLFRFFAFITLYILLLFSITYAKILLNREHNILSILFINLLIDCVLQIGPLQQKGTDNYGTEYSKQTESSPDKKCNHCQYIFATPQMLQSTAKIMVAYPL